MTREEKIRAAKIKLAKQKLARDKKNKITEKDIYKLAIDAMNYVEGLKTELAGGASADLINYYNAIWEEGDYNEALKVVRERREDFKRKYRGSAMAANFLGAMASGGPIGRVVGKIGKTGLQKGLAQLGAGTTEAVTSEVAQRGLDKASIGGATLGSIIFGGIPAFSLAKADKDSAARWAYKTLAPTGEAREIGAKELEIGNTLLELDLIKFYRSKARLRDLAQGSASIKKLEKTTPDLFEWMDVAEHVDSGMIKDKSAEIDAILEIIDKTYKKEAKKLKFDMQKKGPAEYQQLVMEGFNPDYPMPIYASELAGDIRKALKSDVANKKLFHLSDSEIKSTEKLLDFFEKSQGGMTVTQAHKLKKTIGKMLLEADWEKVSPEMSVKKDTLIRIYKALKNDVESAAKQAGELSDSGVDWGKAIKETNRQLGTLIPAANLLSKSAAAEEFGTRLKWTHLMAGGAGATVAQSLGWNEATGLMSAAAIGGSELAGRFGPQVMAKGAQYFSDPGRQYMGTYAATKAGAELFGGPGLDAAEIPPSIQRSAPGAKTNRDFIGMTLETKAPALLREFQTSMYSGDEESVAQILSDVAPQIEEFMEPSPVKAKGVRIKSAVQSPRHPGAYKIGNPQERALLASDIMDDKNLSEAQKLEMVQTLHREGVLMSVGEPAEVPQPSEAQLLRSK